MHADQIRTNVKYTVLGVVTKDYTYIWTLDIPTPELTDVAYTPGVAVPTFTVDVFDYNLTLPVGTTSTITTLSKEPNGLLESVVVHISAAAGTNLTICTDCAYSEVRNP